MTLKMIQPVKTKKEFLEDCTKWCEGFQNVNKVMIAYVRRGKKPTQNVIIQTDDGAVKHQWPARQGKRKPQGVVAAYRGQDGVVRIGWSLCRKTETFNSKVGLRYALERATPNLVTRESIPQSVRKTLNAILERIEKL